MSHHEKQRERDNGRERERETHRSLEMEGGLRRGIRHSRCWDYHHLEHVFAVEGSLIHLLRHLDPLYRVALHILRERERSTFLAKTFL